MSLARSIYRLTLALLLLGGLVCSGSLATPALSAGHYAGSVLQSDPEQDQAATGGQDVQDFYLHSARQSARASGDKEGKPFSGRHLADAPRIDPGLAHCSKSALTRHLRALQEHFTCPQQLSLYPKHWFW